MLSEQTSGLHPGEEHRGLYGLMVDQRVNVI